MTRVQAYQLADQLRTTKLETVRRKTKVEKEVLRKIMKAVWVQNGMVPFVDGNRLNAICQVEGWL